MRSVVLILKRDGLFLGVSRKDDHDDWGFPGGKVEEGEADTDALRRECREECGIELVGEPEEIFRWPNYRGAETAIAYTVADIAGTPHQAEPQGGAVEWVTVDQLLRGKFGDFNEALFRRLGLIW